MTVLLVVVVGWSSKPDAGARSEKGESCSQREKCKHLRDHRAQAIKKTRGRLAAIFGSRIADLTAINGNEPVDTINLHLHFQGPTKETFIDA
ncbi:MAG: hypothetical protein ABSG88_15205 [Bradyrhizobium sp.]